VSSCWSSADSSAQPGHGARVGGRSRTRADFLIVVSMPHAGAILPGAVQPEALIQGLLWFAAFLFSTTVHEAAHALAALRGGDPTAYLGGQVSFSPLPHIRREPVGMLIVPLLTAFTNGWAVGWASTPYDPVWAAHYPRRAATMAAAGPAGNLLIATVAFWASSSLPTTSRSRISSRPRTAPAGSRRWAISSRSCSC